MKMKPNIVLFLIDDMGWKDLTCCGSPFYETPNIDQLCREGMRFSDAYASCPVCSPSRASILTGKYPATVGITDWIDFGNWLHPARGRLVDVPYLRQLPATEYTLAHALKDGGYSTWHVGKWHLGGTGHLPQDHGFDVNVGGCEWGCPIQGYFNPWKIPGMDDDDAPEGTYLTDYLTDRAIALIRNKGPEPFFLNFSHYAVHTPIQAKPDAIRKYEAKVRDLGLDRTPCIEDGEFFPCEHKRDQRVQRRRFQSDPAYAAMIENLDENVGRVMKALADSGEADNTLVIFTSDNGGLSTAEGSPTCNLPLIEGKGWMYEGGTRVPLLAWWPNRIRSGSVCREPVTSPDLFPTLVDIAGLTGRPGTAPDGVSLVPLLTESGALHREAIFWHYPHYGNQGGTPGASVRMGDFKLIEFFEDHRLELYNLVQDPGESRNLVAQDPDRARSMHRVLQSWQTAVEAKIPQPNPDWTP